MAPATEDYDYVVDQNGGGDYERVQAAIDGAKSFPRDRVSILVREGVYEEKVRIHSWNTKIDLVGEDAENTVITHDDHFDSVGRGRNSTFFTYTLQVRGNDCSVRNLTVENSAGSDADQAVALHVEADRAAFANCRFLGNQDTVYAAGEGARQYFRDCDVEGTTDFVFGGATAVFEDCEIHSKADSYVTAASTPERVPFGFVFRDCRLTAESGVSEVYLGRPWRDHAHVAFLRCHLGEHIVPEGWHNWSRPEVEDTVTFAKFENRGPGAADADERVSWATELTPSEAERYATGTVLGCDDRGPSERPWYHASVR